MKIKRYRHEITAILVMFILIMNLCCISVSAETDFAYAKLGKSPDFSGLTLSYLDGIEPNMETGGGRTGWKLQPSVNRGYWQVTDIRSDKYIYCDVDKIFSAHMAGKNVRVSIEYWDRGENMFFITYMSNGRKTDTLPVRLENTKTWKTAEFIMASPVFANELDGMDFRISIYRDGFGYFRTGDNDGVLIGSVCAAPTEQYADGTITASAKACGNNFFTGEKLSFDVEIENNRHEKLPVELKFTSYDFEGKYIEDLGECETVIARGKNQQHFELDISKYGIFYLMIEASNADYNYYTYGFMRYAYIYTTNGKMINDKFGFCNHYAYMINGQNRDPDIGYPLMIKAGSNWSRDEIKWDSFETTKGEYRFQKMHEKYLSAAEQYGINHLLILVHGNSLYGGIGPYKIPQTDEQLEAYGKYCYELVKRLKGRVGAFEFWNEFDLDPTPEATDELYVKLAKVTYESVKRANPEASTVGICAGVHAPEESISNIFGMDGWRYMDDMSFHRYLDGGDYRLKGNPIDTDFRSSINALRKIIDGYKPEMKLWLTETGYSSVLMSNRHRAAAYIVQTFAAAMEQDKVERFFQYDFMCDGINPDNREHNFGLVDSPEASIPYAARTMYASVSAMNNLLGTPVYKDTQVFQNGTVQTYSYKTEQNGRDFTFLWSTEKSSNISLSFGSNDVQFYDMYGNRLEVSLNNGVCELTLSENPIYAVGSFEKITEVTPAVSLESLTVKTFPYSRFTVPMKAHTDDKLFVTAESETGSPALVSPAEVYGNADLEFVCKGTPGGCERVLLKVSDATGTVLFKNYLYVTYEEPIKVEAKTKPYNDDDTAHWVLELNVFNGYGEEVKASLSVEEPSLFARYINNKDLGVLKPKAQNVEDINLPVILKMSSYRVKGTINLANGYRRDFELPVNCALVPKAAAPPSIDGIISPGEWDSRYSFYSYRNDQYIPLIDSSKWSGPNDLSMKNTLMWDDENFYIACEVTDDIHYCPYEVGQAWQGDSVQFGLVFDRGVSESPKMTEIIMAYDGEKAMFKKFSQEDGTSETLENSRCKVVRKGVKTVYEMQIPWKEIMPPQTQNITEGSEFAFSVLVNDNDGFGRRGFMEFGSGIGMTKNSADFISIQCVSRKIN